MGLLETSSSFIIRSFSLRHRSYKRIACDCWGNYPNGEVQYCRLRSIKQDLGYSGVCISHICACQEGYGNSAGHVWTWPTSWGCVSSSSWQAGWWAAIQDIPGGANSTIHWDDEQILCVFCCSFWHSEVSTISLTHSLYAVQKYPLFKCFAKTQQRLLTRHEILRRQWGTRETTNRKTKKLFWKDENRNWRKQSKHQVQ